MKQKISQAMVGKTTMKPLKTVLMAILAGLCIAIGALLYSLLASHGYRALGAISFSIGLILIVFSGAQLFTGNNLLILPLVQKRVGLWPLLKNWLLVYAGNLIGSVIFVFLVSFFAPDWLSIFFNKVSHKKLDYDFLSAFYKAISCNILVCIAVALAVFFEKKVWKILGIIIPIALFVYFGFEHSVANMFFVPMGELSMGESFLREMWKNLIPVTLGNIVGGGGLALLIFLFKREPSANA